MDAVELLSTLGDKYTPEILRTTHEPKSAQELSEELDIPIATSYRRVEQLEEIGLIELEGKEFSQEGRQRKVYRRKVDAITVDLNGEGIEIDLEERTEAKNALTDVWSDLKR